MADPVRDRIFHLILIKPTHYDDDGYPLQWRRSIIPSNTLACVAGLADDCRERRVLGKDVEVRITALDETNYRTRPDKLIAMVRRDGGRGMLGLVGVQTNQFPRAIAIARPFLKAGIPICMGGFHVSGSLAMLDEAPPELVAAADMGISFFIGEAEDGRFEEVIADAYAGKLKPRYDWRDKLPNLEGAPVPFLGRDEVDRTYGSHGSFDLGRGCPFQCSFCTIINVQGRVSRFRSADDLEKIVRANHAIGVDRFFLTDDNLARNRNWQAFFDRLIELRQKEGIRVYLQVQVDTLCHRIPGFIEKGVKAGIDNVFIGMENINPDNLAAVKKSQNRLLEYRQMLLEWKKHPVIITAGYILGMPHDTRKSILHDIDIIKRELPIDLIYFTNLTPLPGCEDHQRLTRQKIWMDPDHNKYDLNHRVTHHQKMSDEEWDQVYAEVWHRFYSFEHIETIFRRLAALGSNKRYSTLHRLLWYRDFHRLYGCHPLEGGVGRMKFRKDRRPGMKLENPLIFYPKFWASEARNIASMYVTYLRMRKILLRILADPEARTYRDTAITAPGLDELSLGIYAETRGTAEAIAKRTRQQRIKDDARSRHDDEHEVIPLAAAE
ncbi:MAG: B12-binding domain-containing radical SAM protein [Propylenella sp.]